MLQWDPLPRNERELGSRDTWTREVPIDHTGDPVAVHHDVVRREVVVAHDLMRPDRRGLPLPNRVLTRLEVFDRPVVVGGDPADLPEHVLLPHPVGPRHRLADGLARKVGENFAPCAVEAFRYRPEQESPRTDVA